jgi:DNA-binding GntR family transcriptional regulator
VVRRNGAMTFTSQWPTDPLVDEIAEILRERIIEGRLAPETPLTQGRIAEDLHTTRAVVGEALRMLDREGLVDRAQAPGAMRVAAIESSVLLSAYVVREVLDGLAARLAARHGGPGIERRCRAALDDQRAAVNADDRLRYMRADISFHATFIDGSGNQVLRRQWSPIRFTARSAMLLALARLRQAVQEHEAILGAVSRGEPTQAERVARAHVRATIDALHEISVSDDRKRLPRPP